MNFWDLVLPWKPGPVTVSVIVRNEGPEVVHLAITLGAVHSQTGTRHFCLTDDRRKADQWRFRVQLCLF